MKACVWCVILFLTTALLPCDEYEAVIYSPEEFKEFSDSGDPSGIYFWDEFPSLRSVYNLNETESHILGWWIGFDTFINSRNSPYCFFPNKLFLIHFNPDHYITGEKNEKYFDYAIGTWEIQGDILKARIYSFILQNDPDKTKSEEKELLFVDPYEIEIISTRFIDPIGYSKIPFNKFRLPRELEGKVKISDKTKFNDKRARHIYTVNVFTGRKGYYLVKIAPDLAKAKLSGADIARSPELIKKYIWNLWP